MVCHKTDLNKFKEIEIMPRIFSGHNGIKLDINNRRKIRIFTNMWKLNSVFLNSQWVKEEMKREIKYLETKWNKNTAYQNLWGVSKSVLWGKFIAINTHIKKKQISNKHYFIPQGTRTKNKILASKKINI